MKRKIAVLLLVVLFVVMFAGCTSNDDELVTVWVLSEVKREGFEGMPDKTTQKFSYDDMGNLTLMVTLEGDTEYERLERDYDRDGKLIRELWLGNEWVGEGYHYRDSVYTGSGDGGTKTYYRDYPDESIGSCECEYGYDKDGNVLWKTLSFYGEVDINEEYTYDDDGNLLCFVRYEHGEETDRCEYTYNKRGRVTQKEECYQGQLRVTEKCEYNLAGKLTRFNDSDFERGFEITYTYDENGCPMGTADRSWEYYYIYTELELPRYQARKLQNNAEHLYMVIIGK